MFPLLVPSLLVAGMLQLHGNQSYSAWVPGCLQHQLFFFGLHLVSDMYMQGACMSTDAEYVN